MANKGEEMSGDLSREELFAMFRLNKDKVLALARNEEEAEEYLDFIEEQLRKIVPQLSEVPTFFKLWELKSQVLPEVNRASEMESFFDQSVYGKFTNQLNSDSTFFAWLSYAMTLLISRYIISMQYVLGDEIKNGSDRQWFMENMAKYQTEVMSPFMEQTSIFLDNLNWNGENPQADEMANDITFEIWSEQLKSHILDLSPMFKESLDTVFTKISSIYLSGIVNGDED